MISHLQVNIKKALIKFQEVWEIYFLVIHANFYDSIHTLLLLSSRKTETYVCLLFIKNLTITFYNILNFIYFKVTYTHAIIFGKWFMTSFSINMVHTCTFAGNRERKFGMITFLNCIKFQNKMITPS